ncbi:MAG: carbohydrate-binding protein [Gemmatimonadota bacterium]|nr:carbohydrate-binding protein [Gemmatimonadota bacterium]
MSVKIPFSRWLTSRRPADAAEDLFAGPIRGELLGAERLAERARTLAREQHVVRERRRRRLRVKPARLLIRLGQTREILEDAYERLSLAAAAAVDVGPAGEWLLDNFHVIREHASQVHESLPVDYFRELPLLVDGPLAEYPRVYEIAITLISHTEGRVDLENVDHFVGAYQEVATLSLGELWAVPAMLRLGLLESVRRMTLRTVQRLEEVEAADRWSERIARDVDRGPAELRATLAGFVAERREITPTFVSRLMQQLRTAEGPIPPLADIEHWFAEEGLGPTDATTRAAERLALTAHMMSNSIMSLRGIAPRDWRQFVEHQSAVEARLHDDPSGDYARMTFATRDDYRHAAERIAKHSDATEVEVAERAVTLAAGHPRNDRRAHVGFWLVDRGVEELEHAVHYEPPVALRVHRWIRRHPNLVYVGGITAGTVAALAPVFLVMGPAARGAWLAVLLVSLLPAFDIAVNVMSQLITAFIPPRILPKLDFHANGVPEGCRTAVVIPTLFADVAAVEDALANLEVQYLANRERNLHFAVLSDFTDADTEQREGDDAIVAAAREGVRALNARHAPLTGDAFYVFHRPRRWNAQQGVWMGWERKRGKLSEFNHYLRGGARDAFSVVEGRPETLGGVRYVITLDSDTVLPPDAAPALIGAISHPLNRAQYSTTRSRVVEGYGILQPRVGVSLASAHKTRFAAVHSGHPGVDPYTTAVSDVYQDLYGEGSFTGKGIYDVDAFERATRGRFPENTLLSHDLIEGNFARAGLVTDIAVFDDYPARYLSFSRRKHRWIRGDWQLLRWLTRWVPGPSGPERNRLGKLARWKILDNLRRSTVEIAQFLFIAAGWTVLPGSPLRWTVLGVLAVAAPWVVALLLALVGPSADKSLRAYYAAVGRDALTSARQVALALIFLAQNAWVSADAILRTLWRLLVSHRRLLEWQSAALTERHTSGSLSQLVRAMWPAVVAPWVLAEVALWRAVMVAGPADAAIWPVLIPIVPLLGAWVSAPLIAHAMSQPVVREVVALDDEQQATTLRYARAHWAFFERFVNAASAWLAPDNFQEDPEPVVALRTSPTNIGLQLLATVSAHDLGFLALPEATERLERAFASMARMRRHRGHFLNWYSLPDLGVLEPSYVSTVDSGNLAGHLIALRQACHELAAAHGGGLGEGAGNGAGIAARLERIADACDRYVQEMDFRFLYDPATKLFAIGFNASTHQLDHASYDLLASEARLASFVAIAKNEIPTEHWFHLGRALTFAHGHAALVSWSGSMFEYLMPILVMRAFPETLLGHTYDGAIARQVHYGAERGVPWGVSESAYNVRDRHFTYQYRAFGVPDLALKRGLGKDLVIAPYATSLAMMVDPVRALQNLRALEALGALGPCGFYDALDYTRPENGPGFAIVRSHMAHHVGMTLVALTNVLRQRRWQERFHADPMVCAAALLLDERVPSRLEYQRPQPRRAEEEERKPVAGPLVREYTRVDTARPQVALLGHAPRTVMVTHAGGGYSRHGALAVTRWRPDGTRDDSGQFCYIKDLATGRSWSAAHQPTGVIADRYLAYLATDRVTFVRTDGDLETRTEIVVVPKDAAEVRRVTVTNNSSETRQVELTSYGEVVLAPQSTDRVHPAFSNLFVETEWHEWCHALTAARRPRAPDEPPVWCAHVLDLGRRRAGEVSYETDRARFLGRGRSTRIPVALTEDGALSGTTGAVLDPIFAIRTRVELGPGQSEAVAFTTLVASSREELFALTDRYHHPHAAQRALDLAWTSTQVELRELGISAADAGACQDLASFILFPDSAVRAIVPGAARNDGWQQTLWAHGISGDWPVVMATIASAQGLSSLQPLLTAHRYWRLRGMSVDLVIVSEEPQGYVQDIAARITELVLATGGASVMDTSGGVHIRNRTALGAADLATISAVARLVVACDGRGLERIASDVARDRAARAARSEAAARTPTPISTRIPAPGSAAVAPRATGAPVPPPPTGPLRFDNGIGGLTAEGNYRMRVRDTHLPPAPWANVIANAHGGFVVTERGGGCTWAQSSYFFRLTPWFNDPVSDPVGDALFLRDEESGASWSMTPAPVRTDATYDVEHAPGATHFRHEHEGIASHLTLAMAGEDPVKLAVLRLTNRGAHARRLTLTSYVEWTLGVLREQTLHRIQTSFDAERGAILAQNPFDSQFATWVAFSSLSAPVTSHTGDRRAFLGRNGTPAEPDGLRAAQLDGRTGAGVDPCAALRCAVDLAPGESRTIVVTLGAAANAAEARQLLDRYRDVPRAMEALDAGTAAWERRLGTVTVATPDPAFDAMVNRWSLYQSLSCRMWARSGTYQSSGAFGFRDQLQDVMGFVYAEPGVARAHIVRAAARQFVEGDVQHWWHPESGRGVRTRFSDDLAWLPHVVEQYVRVTGDRSVLDEEVTFLTMRSLAADEHEAYDLPQVSKETGTVYEHCRRALVRAATSGAHGLPLIGTGDWNDGMNRVGAAGRGESVWLAWFLITTLRDFAPVAEAHGDAASAADFRARADAYARAAEEHAWDGAWYRRAFYDDGTPLGTASEPECQIDSIAQSWSVISGAGSPTRQAQAMDALESRLVDPDDRLIRLLTPPFDKGRHDPGYIKGYVPGVRENGAQYTHAALWAVMAAARAGEPARAFGWFQMLNPLTHTDTPEGVARYRTEPYVVAADVYTAALHTGRGGWTWYTGSASWMYRVGLEEIIGFRKRGDTLTLTPCVPESWPALTVTYRFGGATYAIEVERPGTLRTRGARVELDGKVLDGDGIPLRDDAATHRVRITPRG